METNQNTAVHPSRTARTCHQCVHKSSVREVYQTTVILMCDHPSLPVDEINRAPTTTCQAARAGSCGKDAVLFMPSDPSYSDEFRGKTTIRIKEEVDGILRFKTVLADAAPATTDAFASAPQ